MAKSTFDGKRILAVDDEPDVLATLKEEILASAPECKFEMATTYQGAEKKVRPKPMMWSSSTSWVFAASSY